MKKVSQTCQKQKHNSLRLTFWFIFHTCKCFFELMLDIS